LTQRVHRRWANPLTQGPLGSRNDNQVNVPYPTVIGPTAGFFVISAGFILFSFGLATLSILFALPTLFPLTPAFAFLAFLLPLFLPFGFASAFPVCPIMKIPSITCFPFSLSETGIRNCPKTISHNACFFRGRIPSPFQVC
jgi:hypothetical protein